jgi:hypothetical protein
MLTAAKLPEFLWEPALEHAAYLCNRSFTTFLPSTTPFEKWFGHKPNVAHLCEFGAPVWVLLQGPNVPHKMLPRSTHRAYLGYDDGSQSVKYYTADTHKVLLTCNFQFLSPPSHPTPPEEIAIIPHSTPLREGEAAQTCD